MNKEILEQSSDKLLSMFIKSINSPYVNECKDYLNSFDTETKNEIIEKAMKKLSGVDVKTAFLTVVSN